MYGRSIYVIVMLLLLLLPILSNAFGRASDRFASHMSSPLQSSPAVVQVRSTSTVHVHTTVNRMLKLISCRVLELPSHRPSLVILTSNYMCR